MAVQKAHPKDLIRLIWVKTVPQQPAACIKRGSPMILIRVVSTKTNAGDPTRRRDEGGSTWH